MADEVKNKPPNDGDGLITLARKRYEAGYDREADNIRAAYEDMAFRAGEQWDSAAKSARANRPMLTIDRTSQFVRQVTGDIRQMRPSVTVVPVADGAKQETAEVIEGLFRYIENRSEAQEAYYKAADHQVAAGMGAWRVATEYASGKSFDQEIAILPVLDPLSIVWDPDAQLSTREDALFCFVPIDLSRDAFKARYPDATEEEFSFDSTHPAWTGWRTDDSIRVAEYWFKEPSKVRLVTLDSGKTIEIATPEDAQKIDGAVVRDEVREAHRVMRAVISEGQVLEKAEIWPGRFIPIIPVVGEEIGLGKRVERRGIVRPMKDSQRSLNYHSSMQAEIVALQPKAPFVGTEDNFAAYETMWREANTSNRPYLIYKPDPMNGGVAPQRMQPPVSSQGIAEGIDRATADMQAISGIYPAALGAQSNETSGKAINARAREADTGTYHFIDNFSRAIRYTGRVVVDLIPHVYDAERVIRIAAADGKMKTIEVNKPQQIQVAGENEEIEAVGSVLNDVTVGVYDVVCQSGPSYSTKREEAREGMMQFMQTMPQAAQLIVDYIAKMQDWPYADDIAERLEKTLPPDIQNKLREERGEQPVPPPGPPPEVQLEQAKLQQEAQRDQAKVHVDMAKIELEREKLAIERDRLHMDGATGLMQHEQAMSQPQQNDVAQLAQGLAETQQALMAIGDQVAQITQALQAMMAPPDPGPPPPDMPPQEPPPGGFFVGDAPLDQRPAV